MANGNIKIIFGTFLLTKSLAGSKATLLILRMHALST